MNRSQNSTNTSSILAPLPINRKFVQLVRDSWPVLTDFRHPLGGLLFRFFRRLAASNQMIDMLADVTGFNFRNLAELNRLPLCRPSS